MKELTEEQIKKRDIRRHETSLMPKCRNCNSVLGLVRQVTRPESKYCSRCAPIFETPETQENPDKIIVRVSVRGGLVEDVNVEQPEGSHVEVIVTDHDCDEESNYEFVTG